MHLQGLLIQYYTAHYPRFGGGFVYEINGVHNWLCLLTLQSWQYQILGKQNFYISQEDTDRNVSTAPPRT
jgi:hypothetical protein